MALNYNVNPQTKIVILKNRPVLRVRRESSEKEHSATDSRQNNTLLQLQELTEETCPPNILTEDREQTDPGNIVIVMEDRGQTQTDNTEAEVLAIEESVAITPLSS